MNVLVDEIFIYETLPMQFKSYTVIVWAQVLSKVKLKKILVMQGHILLADY